ncbi:MAG: site-2 protease family protein, partial [Candidatus Buchananbacteria bacterium]|nr:site-2 protease family protein [Candidatus Buchananbacteria bacterium]
MTIVVAALLIFSIIMVHELGHAFMMRQYGVAIKEICLLGLGPKLVSFKWPKVFGRTLLTVRLIPLG